MTQNPTCCRRPDMSSIDDLIFCLSCGHTLDSPVLPCQKAKSTAERALPDLQSDAIALPYTYSPVRDDHFRLIEIQPGQSSDPLICQIFHGRIGNEEYEAISYTWADDNGDQDQTQEVIVCSSLALGLRTVKATRNCENALRRVRSTTDARTIWIDALCIDQSNPAERGHQVHKMPQIYSNATKVIVYLGEASDTSQHLLNTINSLQFGVALEDYLHTHVQEFLGRRWFSRVWCLQEVGMAKYVEMICGGQIVPFERLVLANLNRCAPNADGRLPLILRLPMQEKQSLNNLYDLLEDARISCAASDPRDMVYALLGLVHGHVGLMLQPDYEISVAETYNNTTEFLMKHYNSLDFLSQARKRTPSSAPMASWAIDWTAKTQDKQIVINSSKILERDQISKRGNAGFSFRSVGSARVLTATGRGCSKVLAAAPLRRPNNYQIRSGDWGFIDICGHISRPSAQHWCQHPSMSALTHEAQFDIATMVRILAVENSISRSTFRLRKNKFESNLEAMRSFDNFWYRGKALNEYADFDGDFWEWIFCQLIGCQFWKRVAWDRPIEQSAIFILDDFTIGIGPCDLAHGDKLVQLADSSVWYFMRTKNDHYELVGEYCALPRDTLPADIVIHLRLFKKAMQERSFEGRPESTRPSLRYHFTQRGDHEYHPTTELGTYYHQSWASTMCNSQWDSWIPFWERIWANQDAQVIKLEQRFASDMLESTKSGQDDGGKSGSRAPSSAVSKLFSIPDPSSVSFDGQRWESIDIW